MMSASSRRALGAVAASVFALSACTSSGSDNGTNGGPGDERGTVDMEHGLQLEEHEDWEYANASEPDADVPGVYDAVVRLIPAGEVDTVAFAVSYSDDPVAAEELEDAVDSELYVHTSQFQLGSWTGEDVSSVATTVSDYPAYDKRHVVLGEDGERYSRLILVAAEDESVVLYGFADGDYRDQLNTIMDSVELDS